MQDKLPTNSSVSRSVKFIHMYKKNALNLRYRQKADFVPFPTDNSKTPPHVSVIANNQLKCGPPPAPNQSQSILAKSVKKLPETCQTIYIHHTDLPEIYMDHCDTMNKKYKKKLQMDRNCNKKRK